jgi:hypothetical protein
MSVILRGGMNSLSPADFGAQNGGILVQGGQGKRRRGSRVKKMRGGNTCTGPMTGGQFSPSMSAAVSGGGSRRLVKRTGKARRHRTKSYRAGGKKRKTLRKRKHPKY